MPSTNKVQEVVAGVLALDEESGASLPVAEVGDGSAIRVGKERPLAESALDSGGLKVEEEIPADIDAGAEEHPAGVEELPLVRPVDYRLHRAEL